MTIRPTPDRNRDANPIEPPANEKAARIVDLNRRRADRDAARDGLAVASDVDHETVDPTPVIEEVVVDPPDPPTDVLGLLDQRHTSVLPVWLTDPATRWDTARRVAKAAGYHAAVHAVRLPTFYPAKVAWYAPQGAVKAIGAAVTWVSAERGNFGLRQGAADKGDAKTWLDLDKHRQRQAVWRWWVFGAGAAAIAAAGCLLWTDVLPWSARATVLGAAVLAAARYGRPAGKPILERTVVLPRYRKLTADLTRKGIMATGLVKKPEDITFQCGDIRRDGPGYLAIVDLPDGVVATDVINERDKLARGCGCRSTRCGRR